MLVDGWQLSGKSGSLLLDKQGFIRDCTPYIEDLFEYPRAYLITHHIGKLIPYLAEFPLMIGSNLNPKLSLRSRLGVSFDAIRSDSTVFASYLSVCMVGHDGKRRPRLTVTAVSPATYD